MTSGGCLAINPPPPSAMDHVQQQESTNGRRYQASAGNLRPPAHTRVITDEGVDTEESDRSRRTSSYGSDSSLGSSFTSSSASRSAAGEASAQQAMRRTASTPQQLNASPRVLTVSGVAMLGMPSTAIVRRRPLHETLNEDSEDNFEVALTWHRNNRILLGRLVDAAPKGKLSLVSLISALQLFLSPRTFFSQHFVASTDQFVSTWNRTEGSTSSAGSYYFQPAAVGRKAKLQRPEG
jgi:hypothetical protein